MAVAAVAWRNLGRNRRRTGLTASAVGFASLLLVFSMSVQSGSYALMIDNATRLLTGHLQLQHPDWADDPGIRKTIPHVGALLERLRTLSGVAHAAPRASAFAVLSGPERSFGGQVTGVVPERERAFSTLPELVTEGRYLDGSSGEMVLGAALARNLAVGVGDEVVVLGTSVAGGVAAAAGRVVGLVETGQPQLDRVLLHMPLADFQDAFGLENAAHEVVVMLEHVTAAVGRAERLPGELGRAGDVVARDWSDLMPELEQAIELDRTSGYFFYVLLALMVTFSIANTFMMTIFERTGELGSLLAFGAHPRFIIALLQLEALFLCGLGVLGGTLGGLALTGVIAWVGIPVGEMGTEILRQYHLPERIYPSLSLQAVSVGPLFMLAATQFAALIPALRLWRLEPVDALRAE